MENTVNLELSVLDSMQADINQAAGAMVKQMLEFLPATDILALSTYAMQAVARVEDIGDEDRKDLSFLLILFVELMRSISKSQYQKLAHLALRPQVLPTPDAEEEMPIPSLGLPVEDWLDDLDPQRSISTYRRISSHGMLRGFILGIAEGNENSENYLPQLDKCLKLLDPNTPYSGEQRREAYENLRLIVFNEIIS